jgi:hypothetical protein
MSQLVYNSTVLLPFLNMALDELDEEMAVFELSPLKKESIPIMVPAGSSLLPQMPVNFVESIELLERGQGSGDAWVMVREVADINPNTSVTTNTEITQWTVRGAQILINPPSTSREVLLTYVGGLTAASGVGTTIDVEASRRFLALLTARNAARDLGNSVSKANSYEADISRARDRMIGRMQKNSQEVLGTRRRPYTGRGY